MEQYGIKHPDWINNMTQMRNDIWDKIFSSSIHKGKITFTHAESKIEVFEASYAANKAHFRHKKRETGVNVNYFQHLIDTVDLMLTYSHFPTFTKVLLSLEHDSIECTNKSYRGLRESYGDKIALGVFLISKKPLKMFLNNQEDKDIFEKIRESGVLNDKGTLGGIGKSKKRKNNLNKNESDAILKYIELKEKYKEHIDDEYYSRFKTFGDFYQYALSLKNKNKTELTYGEPIYGDKNLIDLTNEEIEEVCLDSLEVKLMDRLQNIQTLSGCSFKKIIRIINSTRKHLYPIAKDNFPHIIELMEASIIQTYQNIYRIDVQENVNHILT